MFINRRTDQVWYLLTVKYYVVVKRNELKLYVLPWINHCVVQKPSKTKLQKDYTHKHTHTIPSYKVL